MSHIVITTPAHDPTLMLAVKEAVAKRMPDNVVVVVDEVLIDSRLTTDQPYANKNTAYVVMHHGGEYLKTEDEEAIGNEVTAAFPNFNVVMSFSVNRSWAANGQPI